VIPSTYQTALYDWVQQGQGSAIVDAVAGSGKTTTLAEICARIPSSQTVRVLMFNKTISDAFKARVSRSNVIISTYHSAGYQAVARHLHAKIDTDKGKIRDLIKEELDRSDERAYGEALRQMIGIAKGMGAGMLTSVSPEFWQGLVEHHDLDLDYLIPPTVRGEEFDRALVEEQARIWDLASDLLRASNDAADRPFEWRIEFDDQLYLPILWDLPFPTYDWVLVDEAQDTNAIQREILKRSLKPGGRVIAVGDPHQCQPTGTLVERAVKKGRFQIREQVPIEQIQVGDFVTSTALSTGRMTTRRVQQAGWRCYDGELIVVEAQGRESRYTPDHRCVVKHPGVGYCVYVMQRGLSFRVGMSRLCHPHRVGGAGALLRMRAEDADAVWLLATYATKREALVAEQKISAYYHLPQLMFTAKATQGCLFTQEELDSVWREIRNGDRAETCLKDHGRLLAHPYFKRGMRNVSFRRPHVTASANLLPGTQIRLRSGGWATAQVTRQRYTGGVYSLKVEGDELYFADGILTHNSIYGWRGASHDALELLRRTFHAAEFPLSVCYRCATSIVEKAQGIVPQIEAAPGAIEGAVILAQPLEALNTLRKSDAILCRNNAPLVKTAYQLIAKGVACQILGRDIGEGLKTLIYKLHPKDAEDLETRLIEYRNREAKRYRTLKQESKAQGVEDRVQCVQTILEALDQETRTVGAVLASIDQLFGDEGHPKDLLTLSTLHKATGKEWPRVAIIRSDLLPSSYATQPWQLQQELNLQYVAWTRAQEQLWIMDDKPEWLRKKEARERGESLENEVGMIEGRWERG